MRQRIQQHERQVAAGWLAHLYDGDPVDLVFTTRDGGIVNRQAITKVLARAAVSAGIDPKRLGTHVGRRTVVTTLYAEEGVDLADIARHVGHTSTSTTAGYVRSVGDRPKATVDAAARHLDVVPDFVQ